MQGMTTTAKATRTRSLPLRDMWLIFFRTSSSTGDKVTELFETQLTRVDRLPEQDFGAQGQTAWSRMLIR